MLPYATEANVIRIVNEKLKEVEGGSSYKGVTLLETGTYINDGSESPTTYEFSIHSENTIESEEEYWGHAEGDEKSEKSYLLMHTLNNGETVLTPVILLFEVDTETGDGMYGIGTPNGGNIYFSSVEIQDQDIIAYLDSVEDFNNLEDDLKGSSDEIIFPASGTADEDGFTLAIQAPRKSISSEGAFTTYLESAKTILWVDEDTRTVYLTPCKIDIDNMSFNLPGNPINFNNWYIKRGTAFFNFNQKVKEIFIQGSIGGGSGGGSGGPNYQQPYSGTYGRDWYARILAETKPSITIKNLEVDENYMLLRLTYQENAEQETPIETKVFSIVHLEGDDSTQKIYYVVWNIENMHYILKEGEDPIQTDSYLRYYPNIIGFKPELME